jgi:hypothetical protein
MNTPVVDFVMIGSQSDSVMMVYPAHVRIRYFFWFMMLKLSETSSHQLPQFPGTSLRKKFSIAMLKSVKLT